MKRIALCSITLALMMLALVAVSFAADLLPAHESPAFITLPAPPVDATPGNMLLWMLFAVGSFFYALVSEVLPFIRRWRFNGVADFVVQGFKALTMHPGEAVQEFVALTASEPHALEPIPEVEKAPAAAAPTTDPTAPSTPAV